MKVVALASLVWVSKELLIKSYIKIALEEPSLNESRSFKFQTARPERVQRTALFSLQNKLI